MLYVPDNYDLWEKHDAEQQRELEKLPVCDECDEPIQDDHFYEVNDVKICVRCMNEYFRKDTEDYVG